MWAVKNERKCEKNETGSLQRVFPDGHPSRPTGLNFGVRREPVRSIQYGRQGKGAKLLFGFQKKKKIIILVFLKGAGPPQLNQINRAK